MAAATQVPPQTETLLTAEQFFLLSDDDRRTELVQGRIVEVPPTNFRHGIICNRIGRILGSFVEERDLGWVLNNDAGIITARNPDTVRGPDVAFFSYNRIPKGQIPEGYPSVAPELVFEVRSPSDRMTVIAAKVNEYHIAGVLVVCVLDPEAELLAVYVHEELPRRHTLDEELTLPEVFADFAVPVRRFFE
jgi:Uma2 family endonuclease